MRDPIIEPQNVPDVAVLAHGEQRSHSQPLGIFLVLDASSFILP